jgi:hypothetical protein
MLSYVCAARPVYNLVCQREGFEPGGEWRAGTAYCPCGVVQSLKAEPMR